MMSLRALHWFDNKISLNKFFNLNFDFWKADDSVSESKASENEKLLRKAPKNRSHIRKNPDSNKNGVNETNEESPRNKPPIDSKPSSKTSSRINSSQNIRNEDHETKRRIRSRSTSRDRSTIENGGKQTNCQLQ